LHRQRRQVAQADSRASPAAIAGSIAALIGQGKTAGVPAILAAQNQA
jgi:hypothetical protein